MNKVLIYLLLITGLFLSSSDFVYAVIEFDENPYDLISTCDCSGGGIEVNHVGIFFAI